MKFYITYADYIFTARTPLDLFRQWFLAYLTLVYKLKDVDKMNGISKTSFYAEFSSSESFLGL